jgi:hypothetical protein
MTVKSRVAKLEEAAGQNKEIVIYVRHFYSKGTAAPKLPDPEQEIARQRAEGKNIIVVKVPEGK